MKGLMEKVDICLYNFIKWRVRQIFVLIITIIYARLCFALLSYFDKGDNKFLPTMILVSALILFLLIGCSKKIKAFQMTTFEFWDDFFTIRTKSSSIEVPYSDITYIEYVKLTDGRHIDDIIGYKLCIDRRSEHRIRLDYDVIGKNNPAFEDTELYQVYKLLKQKY